MTAAADSARLGAQIEVLGNRGLPYPQLHEQITALLRAAFPVDAACWHGLDPETRLMTTANPVELFDGGFITPETEHVASEYAREDVNQFAVLASRRTPVGILSETTRGRPERSACYREFLEPFGTPHEMRVAMVTRGRVWGCVVLHRTKDTGDFTAAEARHMARLSRPIAERLVISPWTVQDHLKAIFAKTDTRSRKELLSQVFFHDQLPGVMARDPLNAGGHLQPPATT